MNKWTELVHFDPCPGDPYHPNSTPIYQTATFQQIEVDQHNGYDYSRSGNPTRSILEQRLAKLEGANHAFAFTSGMAAITAITRLLSQGEHLIAGSDLYGGSYRLLTKVLPRFGISVSWVDSTDIDAIAAAIQTKTRLILLETPSNPLQLITDIATVADLAQQKNILLAVDNSLMSPWLQKPLSLGADIVIHSATKHLAGHSDLTAGAVIVNNEELAQQFAFTQNAEGSALAPFACWLLLRGIYTLGLRIERQQDNALKIANFFQQHASVDQVYYPGLSSHPQFKIHQQQAKGPGNMISFTINNNTDTKQFIKATRLFSISVSFGSVKSLISLPCCMSHAPTSDSTSPLPKNLVRVSIGIEDVDDLITDLEHAFNQTTPI